MNTNANSAFLREAARVAYGSLFFERRNGGYGSIGVLKDPYGRERIVKFNTRSWEEGVVTKKMKDVSDSLREKLWSVAQEEVGHDPARREKIRNLLNVNKDGKSDATALLTRKVVARVITEIGGKRLWDAALAEKSIKSYRSTGLSTKFSAVYDAATGVGNDARRSRANGELDNAMKAVEKALPHRNDDTLTPFSQKIKSGLEKLLTDDVRRRLADTEGGGKEIQKACQAFIRQNALRLASMYVAPDIDDGANWKIGYMSDDAAAEVEDGKKFLRRYFALGPEADVVGKLRNLGYFQNAQFLRSVYDELGAPSLSLLLREISRQTAGDWNDAEPLRMPEADYLRYRPVNFPLDDRSEEEILNDKFADDNDHIECQTTPDFYRILSSCGLLKGEEGKNRVLTLNRKELRARAQEAADNQARMDEIRADQIQSYQEQLEDEGGDGLGEDFQNGDNQELDNSPRTNKIKLDDSISIILNDDQKRELEILYGLRNQDDHPQNEPKTDLDDRPQKEAKTDLDVHYGKPFAQERSDKPVIPIRRSHSFVLHKPPKEKQDMDVQFRNFKKRKVYKVDFNDPLFKMEDDDLGVDTENNGDHSDNVPVSNDKNDDGDFFFMAGKDEQLFKLEKENTYSSGEKKDEKEGEDKKLYSNMPNNNPNPLNNNPNPPIGNQNSEGELKNPWADEFAGEENDNPYADVENDNPYSNGDGNNDSNGINPFGGGNDDNPFGNVENNDPNPSEENDNPYSDGDGNNDSNGINPFGGVNDDNPFGE